MERNGKDKQLESLELTRTGIKRQVCVELAIEVIIMIKGGLPVRLQLLRSEGLSREKKPSN